MIIAISANEEAYYNCYFLINESTYYSEKRRKKHTITLLTTALFVAGSQRQSIFFLTSDREPTIIHFFFHLGATSRRLETQGGVAFFLSVIFARLSAQRDVWTLDSDSSVYM